MDFGQKLRLLRLQAGLTQKQLGAMIGVTKSVISFYELQERSPSPAALVKIAAVFHVSTDYLLGLEAEKSINISGLNDEDVKVVKQMVDLLRKKNSEKKQKNSNYSA